MSKIKIIFFILAAMMLSGCAEMVYEEPVPTPAPVKMAVISASDDFSAIVEEQADVTVQISAADNAEDADFDVALLCKPISKNELLQYQSLTATSFHKEVANLLDERIIKAYKLSPNNYIAHDILYRKKEYKNMYNETQYNDFVNYMKFLSSHKVTDIEKLKEIFLNIYANPIESKKTYL